MKTGGKFFSNTDLLVPPPTAKGVRGEGLFGMLFNSASYRFKNEVLKALERHRQEVDIRLQAIKTYTDHYSNIIKTEKVSPARLSSMRGCLTLNVRGARKDILQQRAELADILLKFPNLSKEQSEIVVKHNKYVDSFLDSLPEAKNDVQLFIGDKVFKVNDDGSISKCDSPTTEETKKISQQLTIEG